MQTFYFLSTFASEHCHGQFVLRRRPCIRASVSVNIFIYVFDPFFDTRFLHHPSFALCIVWLPSLCLAFSLSRVPFAIHQDRAASDPVATSSIYSSSLAQRAAETTAQTTTTSHQRHQRDQRCRGKNGCFTWKTPVFADFVQGSFYVNNITGLFRSLHCAVIVDHCCGFFQAASLKRTTLKGDGSLSPMSILGGSVSDTTSTVVCEQLGCSGSKRKTDPQQTWREVP